MPAPSPARGAAVGNGATASYERAAAIGLNSRANGMESVVIGAVAKDGAIATNSDVVIGAYAETQNINGESVAIGHKALVKEWRGVAVGYRARSEGISSTAIGRGAVATHTHGVAIGRGARTESEGGVSIGHKGTGLFRLVVNNCDASRFVDVIDGAVMDRDPLLSPILLTGMSGKDLTPSPIPDRPGGVLALAGGAGTGTAPGGCLELWVAPAGADSGTLENAYLPAVRVHPTRDVEVFSGVIVTSPDGYRWRFAIDRDGDWQKELLYAPPPEPEE